MSKPPSKDFALPTAAKPVVHNETTEPIEREPTEDAIDQGVEESFPASDPVSVSITKVKKESGSK